jgi:hypothetical protein
VQAVAVADGADQSRPSLLVRAFAVLRVLRLLRLPRVMRVRGRRTMDVGGR